MQRMVTSAAIEKPDSEGGGTVPWGVLIIVMSHFVVTWGWWNAYAHGAPFESRSHTFWFAIMAGAFVWPFQILRPLWKAGALGVLTWAVITFMLFYPAFWILPDYVSSR